MSGDYSRYDFDPSCDFQGVLLQQGRPLTDEDWNELVAQSFRLAQATALDTFGKGGVAVVPATTPDAFKLTWTGTSLAIGRGRIYVDGLLAENHGAAPSDWDSPLAESFGTSPTLYEKQPYLPNPLPLPLKGTHLAYVDVWKREVNQYEVPQIVEKALGVDTTTRIQTVWQVRILPLNGDAANTLTCDSPIQAWNDLIAPSAGRLSTQTAHYGSSDPCIIPPMGGYIGLENQLYRVEIHDAGVPGKATFKWSRDNASVEARVESITSNSSFVVDSTGKDSVLGFSAGDWIELTDNALELDNQPGQMLRIKTGGVDSATRTITVEGTIDNTLFPIGTPDAARRTRIRRWDQKGQVLRTDTSPPGTYADLNSGPGGVITVPDNNTVSIALENGIAVTFDVSAKGGKFRSGDYWMFAARSVDASVERLDLAPPRGIHHHYARLGFIDVSGETSPTSCRQPWPPAGAAGNCACTVCVSPQAHMNGSPSLQTAIEQVIKSGGGTVCMEAGEYTLQTPLTIEKATAITLRGQHSATKLIAAAGAAIIVADSTDVRLENFSVQSLVRALPTGEAGATAKGSNACIILYGSKQLAVSGLNVSENDASGAAVANSTFAAVACVGSTDGIRIFDNSFTTPIGITSGQLPAAAADAPAAAANIILQLVEASAGPSTINELNIDRNRFTCAARSVSVQLTEGRKALLRICRNEMSGSENRAISIVGPNASALPARSSAPYVDIGSNSIDSCGLAVWISQFQTATVDIRGNTITHSGNTAGEPQCIAVAAVQALAVTDNNLTAVGQIQYKSMTGILVQQCPQVRISRNNLVDVGPPEPANSQVAAIRIAQATGTVDIHDNLIGQTNIKDPTSAWYGIMVNGQARDKFVTTISTTATRSTEGTVSVHSNQILAYFNAVIAFITTVKTCNYCNNQSVITNAVERRPNNMGDIVIAAHALIVCNNSIAGSPHSALLSADSNQQKPPEVATVLGNVTLGDIVLNNQLLPVPWAPLNVKM